MGDGPLDGGIIEGNDSGIGEDVGKGMFGEKVGLATHEGRSCCPYGRLARRDSASNVDFGLVVRFGISSLSDGDSSDERMGLSGSTTAAQSSPWGSKGTARS